jgi:hypothetical protein
MNRTVEIAEIDRFLQEHGARRCEPAFAAPVTSALPPRIEAQRVAAVIIRQPTREEIIARLKRQARLMFFG